MSNRLPFLYLHDSEDKGRGVFTGKEILEGSIIEICPIIKLSAKDVAIIHETRLHDYYFFWGTKGEGAIALGYGSIYNHAKTPNADYEMNIGDNTITFFATRAIDAGEEITVSYSQGGEQEGKLWFEVKE